MSGLFDNLIGMTRTDRAANASPVPLKGKGKEIAAALFVRQHLERRLVGLDAQRRIRHHADLLQRSLLQVAVGGLLRRILPQRHAALGDDRLRDALFFAKDYGKQELANMVFMLFVLPAGILAIANRLLPAAAVLAGTAAFALRVRPVFALDGAVPDLTDSSIRRFPRTRH